MARDKTAVAAPASREIEPQLERLVDELRARGHRVTPQRVAVIREFLGRDDHPSAEALHRAVAAHYPMMAVSTVYSTLKLLGELGAAAELAPGFAEARFDPNVADHCHLICRRCGAIIDVAPEFDLGALGTRASAAHAGFRAERVTLDLYGTCARCAAGRPE